MAGRRRGGRGWRRRGGRRGRRRGGGGRRRRGGRRGRRRGGRGRRGAAQGGAAQAGRQFKILAAQQRQKRNRQDLGFPEEKACYL